MYEPPLNGRLVIRYFKHSDEISSDATEKPNVIFIRDFYSTNEFLNGSHALSCSRCTKVQLLVLQECVKRNIENIVRGFTGHSKPQIKNGFTRYGLTPDNRLPDGKPLATNTQFVFLVEL